MCTIYQASNRLVLGILLVALSFATAPPVCVAQPDLRQQVDALTAATSLDRPGMLPWHMRLSFQLFDPKGKPKETGTVEEWWAAPDRSHVVITSHSLNETLPGSSLTSGRESYLIHLLLREVVHPMLVIKNPSNFIPAVVSNTFGQKSL